MTYHVWKFIQIVKVEILIEKFSSWSLIFFFLLRNFEVRNTGTKMSGPI